MRPIFFYCGTGSPNVVRNLRKFEMRPSIQEITISHTPESLVEQLHGQPGIVLLRSGFFDSPQARYSFVTAKPFLTFRSFGSRCELTCDTPPAQRNFSSATRGMFWMG